jgi:hypothetical protein
MPSRVKINLIQKCELGWMSTQGQNLRKTIWKKYGQRVTCSKLSSVVATANFQQKE